MVIRNAQQWAEETERREYCDVENCDTCDDHKQTDRQTDIHTTRNILVMC